MALLLKKIDKYIFEKNIDQIVFSVFESRIVLDNDGASYLYISPKVSNSTRIHLLLNSISCEIRSGSNTIVNEYQKILLEEILHGQSYLLPLQFALTPIEVKAIQSQSKTGLLDVSAIMTFFFMIDSQVFKINKEMKVHIPVSRVKKNSPLTNRKR